MTRKIEVVKWIEGEGENTAEMNTMKLIDILINNKKPEELPRGWDNFRTFKRIYKSFDKALETGFIEIDDADYVFMRKIIEKDVPARWAGIEKACKAMDNFMESKEEE